MFKNPACLKGKKVALQFRAGKMTLANGKVTPDTRKGLIALIPDTTGAMELMWCPLDDSEPDVYCVFPNTATVSRVKKCTTGRVMLIDLQQERQLFFWLQDRSEDRDAAIFKKTQQLLVPPVAKPAAAAAPTAAAATAAAPSPPPARAAAAAAGGNAISVQALQNILADLQSSQGGSSNKNSTRVNLQALLGSDALLAALNEDRAFYTDRLRPHLPTAAPTTATAEGAPLPPLDIVDEVRNPQVSATGALLQEALEDPDGFREITSAFTVTGSNAAGGGVAAFLQRLLEEAEKKNAPK